MLRSVSEVSDLIGVSKVSIYNKLKSKEFEKYILKHKGITYISEEGFIKLSKVFNIKKEDITLNCNEKIDDNISSKYTENKDSKELSMLKVELHDLKNEYINFLKNEISNLTKQLSDKDKQIEELIMVNINNQILLKKEKEQNLQELEDHFKEIDDKLLNLRVKLESKNKKQNKLLQFFKFKQ